MNYEIKKAIETLSLYSNTGYVNEDTIEITRLIYELSIRLNSNENELRGKDLKYTYIAYIINNLYEYLYKQPSMIKNDKKNRYRVNLNKLLIEFIINKMTSYDFRTYEIQKELQDKFLPFVLKDMSVYEEVYIVYKIIREKRNELVECIKPLLDYFNEITDERYGKYEEHKKNKLGKLICNIKDTTEEIFDKGVNLHSCYRHDSAAKFKKLKLDIEVHERKEGLNVKIILNKKLFKDYIVGGTLFFPIHSVNHPDFKIIGASSIEETLYVGNRKRLLSFILPWENVKELIKDNYKLIINHVFIPNIESITPDVTSFINEPITIDLEKCFEKLNYI